MKVGDIVKHATPIRGTEGGRYLLVEHHGDEATIRPADGSIGATERVRLADLALVDNAPLVVDPEDD